MPQYCYGCMSPLQEGAVCGCGHQQDQQNHSHQLPAGTVLRQRYLIGKVLGQGGFGITYIGRDLILETTVAIKEFYPHTRVTRNVRQSLAVSCADDGEKEQFQRSRDRFLKEARTLAKLNDVPGIVHVQNMCLENNTAYIIMEYLDGEDLKQHLLRQNAPMTAEQTLNFFQPVLFALRKVHEQGLIHRDISPDNIMVLRNGGVKLLDFGAARELDRQESGHTFASELVVKQGFAPIEQYRENADLGPGTDIYAVCASMYYCMTGRVPNNAPDRFMGNDNVDWTRIPGLTEGQTAGLAKGLAIRTGDRLASVEQLWETLYNNPEEPEHPQEPEETDQPEEDFREKEPDTGGGKKRVPLLVVAVLLLVAAAAGFWYLKGRPAAEDPVLDVPPTTQATVAAVEAAMEAPAEAPKEGLPVTMAYSNGTRTFTGENLQMKVVNNSEVTVTLSGLEVKSFYSADESVIGWRVAILGEQSYMVYTQIAEEQVGKGGSIADMYHELYSYNPETKTLSGLGDASMSHTETSITWKFTMPYDEAADFSGTTGFETWVNVPYLGEDRQEKYYVDTTVPEAPADEDGQEAAWKKNLLTPDLTLQEDTEAFLAGRATPSLSELYVFYSNRPVYGSEIPRKRIAEVFFLDTLADAPEDAWDVSYNQDGSVLAWTQKNWKYSDFALDLYIAGEGGVNGSMACNDLFCGYTELAAIHFNDAFHAEEAVDMSDMFAYCRRLSSLNLFQLDTSSAEDMSRMFYCCESLTALEPKPLNTSRVKNMEGMFSNCTSLVRLNLQGLNTSNVENMANLFAGCTNLTTLACMGMDTSNVVNMSGMYSGLSSMKSITVSLLDTSKVTDMSNMFSDCIVANSITLGQIDTSNVENMSGMFRNCEKLYSLDSGSLNTSKVTDMSEMFYNCYVMRSFNLRSFDTSNVTTMRSMFEWCFSVERLDVSHFHTPKVRDFSRMFYGCKYLTIVDVLDYDVSSMETAKDMFSGCGNLNLEFKKLGGEYIWSS